MAGMLATGPPRSAWEETMSMLKFLPEPSALIEKVRLLPAARPLLARLGDRADGLYLVGGAVRDLLLGGTPFDLDLVAEGDAAALAASLGGQMTVHDRFGTSTVRLDGYVYDLARARRETYARPGRWRISISAGSGSCTTAASSTTPRGCCAWPGTPAAWTSPSRRTPASWPPTRSPLARSRP
jgi:hypothetical protein